MAGKASKADQTPAQRRKIDQQLVGEVRKLLRPLPLEVIGHIDSQATCCRNGTVALVKIERTAGVAAKVKPE